MIDSLTISAPAKINLFLHLRQKLPNGYHELQSFIIFINLFDKIIIKKTSSTTNSLEITGPLASSLVASKEDNLIIKVINYLKQQFNITSSLAVILEKHIPVAAGLAGGSSDAAAVLKGLNILWDLRLSNQELTTIAAKFGADIPSCIYSQSGLIEGIGEQFTAIPLNFTLPLLLVSNTLPLTTKAVYEKTTILGKNTNILAAEVPTNRTDFLEFIKKQSNNLTEAASSILPEINTVLSNLQQTKPVISRLTGSGSTCFAIYNTTAELMAATKQLRQLYPNYLISTASNLIT